MYVLVHITKRTNKVSYTWTPFYMHSIRTEDLLSRQHTDKYVYVNSRCARAHTKTHRDNLP